MRNLFTLPNFLTCCNLLCGAVACYYAFQGNYDVTFCLICAGAVFDFFDGFAARLTHQSSPIGKELDSLADDITFGLAPAACVFSLLESVCANMPSAYATWLPFCALLIAVFSALRLAKFNLDERQTLGFIGLPTPANAFFWFAFAYSFGPQIPQTNLSVALLIGGILLSSFLLVSEIPMFALKFKNFSWKDNALRYLFLLACLILSLLLKERAFVYITPLYILTSVGQNLFSKR